MISVVIPTLDEEDCVAAAIGSATAAGPGVEVIVVDGGSRDRTVARAAATGARVLTSARGRGLQLDFGARRSSGTWLVFLHADTRLEAGWDRALADVAPGVVGGAFRFAVDSARGGYRIVEAGVALRCRTFLLPFGDQGLFVRRRAYFVAGGFPPLPLMEDVAFVRRLAAQGPLAFLGARAYTSPRRWERRGLLNTTLRNWGLLALYAAGLPPHRLARLY